MKPAQENIEKGQEIAQNKTIDEINEMIVYWRKQTYTDARGNYDFIERYNIAKQIKEAEASRMSDDISQWVISEYETDYEAKEAQYMNLVESYFGI